VFIIGLQNLTVSKPAAKKKQSSQVRTSLTLGSDVVATTSVTTTPGLGTVTLSADVGAALGSTVMLGHGTVALAGVSVAVDVTQNPVVQAGITLASDLPWATVTTLVTPDSGAVSVTLADDTMHASGTAQQPAAASVIVALVSDTVRAAGVPHDTASIVGTVGLGNDTMRASGTALATAFTAPALVLGSDLVVVPSSAHVIGHTAPTIVLGDDAVLAIEGASRGILNHHLAGDIVQAAGLLTMPGSDGAAAFILGDDRLLIVPEAFPPVTAAVDLTLADDVVRARGQAAIDTSREWADPFAATKGPRDYTPRPYAPITTTVRTADPFAATEAT
jgi:hypothetical protein